MASLFKRADIWWVKYYLNGKAVSKSLKTCNKQVATREKQAIEAKLLEPQRATPSSKNPTCEMFWKKYLAYAIDHKRPNTVEIETNHWNQLLEFTNASRLGDITREQVEGFKVWKRDRKKKNGDPTSPSSVNSALKDIRTIFNYAIKLGMYTGSNPVQGVAFYKVTRELPRFHTEEELAKLLEEARKSSKELEWVVLLGSHAGLRKNELLSARWEWFDFQNKQIRIRRHKGFEIKDHEERVIPMHSLIKDALEPHSPGSGPLFQADKESAGKNRYPFEPKRSMNTALKRAGLSTDEPFQRLRETFASLRAQKGISIYKLSKWLGHSSVQVTEKHYAALATGYDTDIE